MSMARKRVVVYTAVLGAYDARLPTLRDGCSAGDIEFVAFVDGHYEVSGPWKLVRVEPPFLDTKISALWFKANPHLFFPAQTRCVWVDGNLEDLCITAELVEQWLATSPVAVPRHRQRSNALEESQVLQALQLDDPFKLERTRARLRDVGEPQRGPLSATMLLARDLSSPRLRGADHDWWTYIVDGSRRDQMSFDHAMSSHGIEPAEIDVDWRERNAVFGRVGHREQALRAIPGLDPVAVHFSSMRRPRLPADYPFPSYFAERISAREAEILRAINAVVERTSDVLEGNYAFFHQTPVNGYVPVDPRRAWKREFLRRAVVGSRRIAEIGFNAGHSTCLMLCQAETSLVTAVDICATRYVAPCAALLSETFGDRFRLVVGDSRVVLGERKVLDAGEFDLVHIDGGHGAELFANDLAWFVGSARKGGRVVVDDCYAPSIRNTLEEAVAAGRLIEIQPNFISSGENRLYALR